MTGFFQIIRERARLREARQEENEEDELVENLLPPRPKKEIKYVYH